jgi:predicted  nucleic acid-binding Zn-ribbon protein
MDQLVGTRTTQLGSAFEVERFHRDASETNEWMREKTNLMPADLGRDVGSVEALRRQHAAFERDLQAIAAKETSLRTEADDLKTRHHDEVQRLDTVQGSVADKLRELQQKSRERQVQSLISIQSIDMHPVLSLTHRGFRNCWTKRWTSSVL